MDQLFKEIYFNNIKLKKKILKKIRECSTILMYRLENEYPVTLFKKYNNIVDAEWIMVNNYKGLLVDKVKRSQPLTFTDYAVQMICNQDFNTFKLVYDKYQELFYKNGMLNCVAYKGRLESLKILESQTVPVPLDFSKSVFDNALNEFNKECVEYLQQNRSEGYSEYAIANIEGNPVDKRIEIVNFFFKNMIRPGNFYKEVVPQDLPFYMDLETTIDLLNNLPTDKSRSNAVLERIYGLTKTVLAILITKEGYKQTPPLHFQENFKSVEWMLKEYNKVGITSESKLEMEKRLNQWSDQSFNPHFKLIMKWIEYYILIDFISFKIVPIVDYMIENNQSLDLVDYLLDLERREFIEKHVYDRFVKLGTFEQIKHCHSSIVAHNDPDCFITNHKILKYKAIKYAIVRGKVEILKFTLDNRLGFEPDTFYVKTIHYKMADTCKYLLSRDDVNPMYKQFLSIPNALLIGNFELIQMVEKRVKQLQLEQQEKEKEKEKEKEEKEKEKEKEKDKVKNINVNELKIITRDLVNHIVGGGGHGDGDIGASRGGKESKRIQKETVLVVDYLFNNYPQLFPTYHFFSAASTIGNLEVLKYLQSKFSNFLVESHLHTTIMDDAFLHDNLKLVQFYIDSKRPEGFGDATWKTLGKMNDISLFNMCYNKELDPKQTSLDKVIESCIVWGSMDLLLYILSKVLSIPLDGSEFKSTSPLEQHITQANLKQSILNHRHQFLEYLVLNNQNNLVKGFENIEWVDLFKTSLFERQLIISKLIYDNLEKEGVDFQLFNMDIRHLLWKGTLPVIDYVYQLGLFTKYSLDKESFHFIPRSHVSKYLLQKEFPKLWIDKSVHHSAPRYDPSFYGRDKSTFATPLTTKEEREIIISSVLKNRYLLSKILRMTQNESSKHKHRFNTPSKNLPTLHHFSFFRDKLMRGEPIILSHSSNSFLAMIDDKEFIDRLNLDYPNELRNADLLRTAISKDSRRLVVTIIENQLVLNDWNISDAVYNGEYKSNGYGSKTLYHISRQYKLKPNPALIPQILKNNTFPFYKKYLKYLFNHRNPNNANLPNVITPQLLNEIVEGITLVKRDLPKLYTTNLENTMFAFKNSSTGIIKTSTIDSGDFNIIKFLHFNNCTVSGSSDCMDNAAGDNNLQLLTFMHFNRSEGCTNKAINKASKNGHLQVVQFLNNHRTEGCTKESLDKAVQYQFFELVKYLHYNRTEGCTSSALNYSDLSTSKFLHINRTEGCTKDAVDLKSEYCWPQTLNFLMRNRTEGGTIKAFQTSDSYILHYLYFNSKFEYELDKFSYGSKKCDYGTIKLFIEHMGISPHKFAEAAERQDILEYLVDQQELANVKNQTSHNILANASISEKYDFALNCRILKERLAASSYIRYNLLFLPTITKGSQSQVEYLIQSFPKLLTDVSNDYIDELASRSTRNHFGILKYLLNDHEKFINVEKLYRCIGARGDKEKYFMVKSFIKKENFYTFKLGVLLGCIKKQLTSFFNFVLYDTFEQQDELSNATIVEKPTPTSKDSKETPTNAQYTYQDQSQKGDFVLTDAKHIKTISTSLEKIISKTLVNTFDVFISSFPFTQEHYKEFFREAARQSRLDIYKYLLEKFNYKLFLDVDTDTKSKFDKSLDTLSLPMIEFIYKNEFVDKATLEKTFITSKKTIPIEYYHFIVKLIGYVKPIQEEDKNIF